MQLKNLQLHNLRSFKSDVVPFDPRLTVLVGARTAERAAAGAVSFAIAYRDIHGFTTRFVIAAVLIGSLSVANRHGRLQEQAPADRVGRCPA